MWMILPYQVRKKAVLAYLCDSQRSRKAAAKEGSFSIAVSGFFLVLVEGSHFIERNNI